MISGIIISSHLIFNRFKSAFQVCQLTNVIEKQSEVIMNLNSSLKDLEDRVFKMNDKRVRN